MPKCMNHITLLISIVLLSNTVFATETTVPATSRMLLQNDRISAYELHFPAGAVAPEAMRPYRIVRALSDGTVERIHPDGRRETASWRQGEVRELGPDQYALRNIGKSAFAVYVVEPKTK